VEVPIKRMVFWSPLLLAVALAPALLQSTCAPWTGNPNLVSLEIEAGAINRLVAFNNDTRTYSVWLDGATTVTIRAEAEDPSSYIRWILGPDFGTVGVGTGETTINAPAGGEVLFVQSTAPGKAQRMFAITINPPCALGDCNDADPCTVDSCDGGSATCWFRQIADGAGECSDGVGVDRTVCQLGCDFVSIQAAIDAANDGDAILVGPGTYYEHIDFLRKHISPMSTDGAEFTVIDGTHTDTVVRIEAQTGGSPLLEGFTITNGRGTHDGGGVDAKRTAAVIRRNIIRNNLACYGAGIRTYFSPVIIEDNLIRDNYDGGCTGNDGGGIHIGGTTIPAVSIAGNRVLENESYNGGGIGVTTAEGTTVWNNEVGLNIARSAGGGIYFGGNFDRVYAVQNVVYGNSAARGGGIEWDRGNPRIINNTVADNDSDLGSGLYGEQHNYETQVINNIIVASPGQGAVFCSGFRGDGTFRYNNVFSTDGGNAYDFICNDQTGTLGNVSMAPGFVDRETYDYALQESSPMVDAGDVTAPHLPTHDFDAHPRVTDGNLDGVRRVDIGAFELQPEDLHRE